MASGVEATWIKWKPGLPSPQSLEAFELCPSQGIHWRAADSGRADSNLLVADLQMLLEGMIQCHRMPQISWYYKVPPNEHRHTTLHGNFEEKVVFHSPIIPLFGSYLEGWGMVNCSECSKGNRYCTMYMFYITHQLFHWPDRGRW